MIVDYKLLDALSAVVRHQGFDAAARAMHLTQSAISQRIKALEELIGQPLLVRGTPIGLTAAGRRLLQHGEAVRLMERELLQTLADDDAGDFARLAIASNADSAATWLIPAVAPLLRQEKALLELVLDDQDYTHQLLRNGEVVGCISNLQAPLPGCKVDFLGAMHYWCVASPDFVARHFPDGIGQQAIRRAPVVNFNAKDDLQRQFLSRRFGLGPGDYPQHAISSTESYLAAILAGIGFGLVPELQAHAQLARGELVRLIPEPAATIELYWHRWQRETPLMARLTQTLLTHASAVLAQGADAQQCRAICCGPPGAA
ncbi:LysR family transcriptional regulator ArgP [Chitinivorax sp. PXF-14]|uniref:LysR family transcriptional regulator ArgP n=1 Tax=Chitinivorax sp. PXF-14 TaxID=3230488 RepID=UPI003465D87C